MAILGTYTGMAVLYSISSSISGKKKKPAKEESAKAVAAPTAVASDGVPDVESPAFDRFIESGALDKLLDNEQQLKALTG